MDETRCSLGDEDDGLLRLQSLETTHTNSIILHAMTFMQSDWWHQKLAEIGEIYGLTRDYSASYD